MYSNQFFGFTVCPLCKNANHPCVENSHLVPKFFRKLAKRPKARFLAGPAKGTKYQQDLPKVPLLCSECDNVTLSRLEKELQATLATHDWAAKAVERNEMARRAALSVVWRFATVAHYFQPTPKNLKHYGFWPDNIIRHISNPNDVESVQALVDSALERWRKEILGLRASKEFPFYVFLDTPLEDALRKVPAQVYKGQVVAGTTPLNVDTGFLYGYPGVICYYVAIKRLLFVGVIQNQTRSRKAIEELAENQLRQLYSRMFE
jgi:hypothetical protein